MKKYLAILLTVLYFGSSSGMVYNVHNCLNQVYLSSAAASKTCNICGTKKKKDCCKDEVKIVKTDVAQKADISFLNEMSFVAILPKVFYTKFLPFAFERNYLVVNINAPPEKARPPLFISFCNFRI